MVEYPGLGMSCVNRAVDDGLKRFYFSAWLYDQVSRADQKQVGSVPEIAWRHKLYFLPPGGKPQESLIK